MDENRDIYQSRGDAPPPSGPSRPMDMGLDGLRRRTRTTTILLALFMLGLLSAAIWLIRKQEKKLDREESGEVLSVPGATPVPLPSASQLGQSSTGGLPAAESAPPLEPPTPPAPRAGAPALTPEQSAQAMTELRTAHEYLRARDLDRAEEHTRRALAIWPEWTSALRVLGLIYTQRGQFEQAIAALDQAIAQDPMSAEAVNSLATAYMQKGWMGRAEELLHKVEVMNPNYWPAHLNLGLLYILKKDYGPAVDYLERAVEQVPKDAGPRNNLGVAQMRIGRFEDARRNFQVIIDQAPENPAPYFNIAISYVLEKKLDESLEWIRKGAERCSPMTCQSYLADQAFNPLRNYGPFQQLMPTLYPQLPAPPSP